MGLDELSKVVQVLVPYPERGHVLFARSLSERSKHCDCGTHATCRGTER
jgi:hypothetical protein